MHSTANRSPACLACQTVRLMRPQRPPALYYPSPGATTSLRASSTFAGGAESVIRDFASTFCCKAEETLNIRTAALTADAASTHDIVSGRKNASLRLSSGDGDGRQEQPISISLLNPPTQTDRILSPVRSPARIGLSQVAPHLDNTLYCNTYPCVRHLHCCNHGGRKGQRQPARSKP